LLVVTPQQWVPTPIKLEESGCPERHKCSSHIRLLKNGSTNMLDLKQNIMFSI